jgi:hypothetical protein
VQESEYEQQVELFGKCLRDFTIARYNFGRPYLSNFFPSNLASFSLAHPEYSRSELLTSAVSLGRYMSWMIHDRPEQVGINPRTKQAIFRKRGFIQRRGFTGGRWAYRILPHFGKKVSHFVETGKWHGQTEN